MNLKDKLIVKIDNLDHYGRGVVHLDDKVIFVDNALIDEVVEISVTSIKKRIVEAKVIKYLEISPKRIEPICPYFELCGGCSLMHISYDEQCLYKENKVKEIMKKFANIDQSLIKSIIKNDEPLFYRNKVTFQVNDRIGFYENKSNKVVKIEKCYISDEKINELIPELNKIKDLDKVVVKASKHTDDVMLDLEGEIEPNINATSVYFNRHLSSGEPYIYEKLGNFKFRISRDGFFQVNTNQTIKLYDKVKEYLNITNKDNLLDLYCGAGTIGIYVGGIANKVLGIEINESAIENAYVNKELNGIRNIDFKLGDVSKLISEIEFAPTKIVVDPPRAGLDTNTINYLNNSNVNTIVYVSCDPVTLARDLKLLDNYEVAEITPLDMFSNTYHVENITKLILKNEGRKNE